MFETNFTDDLWIFFIEAVKGNERSQTTCESNFINAGKTPDCLESLSVADAILKESGKQSFLPMTNRYNFMDIGSTKCFQSTNESS